MPTRVIRTEEDRALLLRYLRLHKLPFTIEVHKGERRSTEQNRLQRLWIGEIADHLDGNTPEEIRGYCKLHFGVPILREENEGFREKYDKHIRDLPYDRKIAIMMEPLDLPITRLMTTEQKSRYLDAVFKHFTEQGVVLTIPPDKYAARAA